MFRIEDKPELIIGLVAPAGVDLESISNKIRDYLKQFNYEIETIKLSALIQNINGLETKIVSSPEDQRIDSYMTAGNEAREKSQRGDILAALGVCHINQQREEEKPFKAKAFIFNSLKHPEEVDLLRNIYEDGFYLLGVSSSRTNRVSYFEKRHDIPKEKAKYLIDRDESENIQHGQHTRDVFYLADAFVNIDNGDSDDQIRRIIDLLFGNPHITPTKDEYAMFLAFSASLRSGDLSRQVGAIITSEKGEVIATGANDVPCYGGGLYWIDMEKDERDYKRGYDSNAKRKDDIVLEIMKKIESNNEKEEKELLEEGHRLLADTGLLDITEYGRAVHAEMEALLCCARTGSSPQRGTLYCTTFPCHNCAKHIIAAGISKVVFVEPYPKSLAKELHNDAISLAHEDHECEDSDKVIFKPFVGIGPKRFIDLFSLKLGRGRKIKRERDGEKICWQRGSAALRVPLLPISYIDRETLLASKIDEQIGGEDGANQE